MYDQLPMQISLMEHKRERDALMREAEILRELGDDPAASVRLARWAAAARGWLAAAARPRTRQQGGDCRAELGSSAVA